MTSAARSTKLAAVLAAALALLPVACNRRPARPEEFTVSGRSVSYWTGLLRDGKSSVRERIQAVRALGNVGDADAAALPALTAALDDRDARVRAEAVLALGKSGPKASAAVPRLKRLTRDPDPRVSRYAAKVLARIEGE